MGGGCFVFQGISGERFVHHTSFLWDFTPKRMDYLLMPKRVPEYRANRQHDKFLCAMKEFVSVTNFWARFEQQLKNQFEVVETKLDDVIEILHLTHTKRTLLVDLKQ